MQLPHRRRSRAPASRAGEDPLGVEVALGLEGPTGVGEPDRPSFGAVDAPTSVASSSARLRRLAGRAPVVSAARTVGCPLRRTAPSRPPRRRRRRRRSSIWTSSPRPRPPRGRRRRGTPRPPRSGVLPVSRPLGRPIGAAVPPVPAARRARPPHAAPRPFGGGTALAASSRRRPRSSWSARLSSRPRARSRSRSRLPRPAPAADDRPGGDDRRAPVPFGPADRAVPDREPPRLARSSRLLPCRSGLPARPVGLAPGPAACRLGRRLGAAAAGCRSSGAAEPLSGAPARSAAVGGRRHRAHDATRRRDHAGKRRRNGERPGQVTGAPRVRNRRRPTLPGTLIPSTIGAGGLNFRVRNGNGCDPAAMATETCCQTGAPMARP